MSRFTLTLAALLTFAACEPGPIDDDGSGTETGLELPTETDGGTETGEPCDDLAHLPDVGGSCVEPEALGETCCGGLELEPTCYESGGAWVCVDEDGSLVCTFPALPQCAFTCDGAWTCCTP